MLCFILSSCTADSKVTDDTSKPLGITEESEITSNEETTSDTAKQSEAEGKTAKQESTTKPDSKGNADTSSGNGGGQTSSQAVSTTSRTTEKASATTSSYITCNIEIECSSVLSHMDELKAGHEDYIPQNGIMLSRTSYSLKNGSTVYDLVSKACSDNGIALNVTSSAYGKYIAGINNLDEKDCGKSSGWMYMVNGSYPSISYDKKTLSDGDSVIFTYTCER